MASAKTRNGNASEDLRPPNPHNHPHPVILNSFQDLSAEKDKKWLAVRC